MSEIPVGLCQCGCGLKTNTPNYTNRKRGYFKGVPQKFYPGHYIVRSNQYGVYNNVSREELFWKHVDIKGEDDCWEWSGQRRKPKGSGWGNYGCFNYKSVEYKAHRVAYEIVNGEIPEGMFVCHKCDNPPCVNPKHLFLGTNEDNMKDMASKGRTGVKLGSNHPNHKLVEKDVPEIRKLLSQGFKISAIAEIYGVSNCPISMIRRGKSWRHVK